MKKQPFTSELNHRIAVKYNGKIQSATGEEKTTLVLAFNAWAKMLQNEATEDIDGKVRQLIDNRYLIRYRKEVLDDTKTFYVEDSGKTYRIHHVKEIEKNAWLELLVTAYE